MSVYSLPAVLAFALELSVALRVLMDRPRSTANRLFFAFILSFAAWSLGEVIMINAETWTAAVAGAYLISLGFFLSPAIFLLITFHFPRRSASAVGRPPWATLVPAFPVALLAVALPRPMMDVYFVPSLANIHFHALPSLRWWTLDVLLAVNVVYLGWGIGNLVAAERRAASDRERLRARLLIGGFLTIELVAIGAHFVHLIIPLHRGFFLLSTALSVLVSAFFALAILRYRIINMRRILQRGLGYLLLSALVLSFYFLLVRQAVMSLGAAFGVESFVLDGALIFILMIFIRPLDDGINQVLEQLLSSRRVRLRERIDIFSREIARETDWTALLDRVEEFLRNAGGATDVGILLERREDDRFVLRSRGDEAEVRLPLDGAALRRIAVSTYPLEVEEFTGEAPGDELAASLERMGYRYMLPMRLDGELLGIIALGAAEGRADFSADELDLLGIVANDVGLALSRVMAIEARRAQEARLHQAEKLAALGQLVAGVAHEIRNPLNVISSSAQTLQRKALGDEDRRRLLGFIVDEAERLNELLTEFLQLARPRAPSPRRGRLDELLDAVARTVEPRTSELDISVDVVAPPTEIVTDFAMVEQILVNLAINGVEAMSEGGTLTLRASADTPGWLVFAVADIGPGIPEKAREHLFEPFFTTKETGTGLGLSIVYTLVQTLGGRIDHITGADGTTFRVEIPRGDKAQ